MMDTLEFAALDQVYLLLEVVKPTTLTTYMCALLTKQYANKAVC